MALHHGTADSAPYDRVYSAVTAIMQLRSFTLHILHTKGLLGTTLYMQLSRYMRVPKPMMANRFLTHRLYQMSWKDVQMKVKTLPIPSNRLRGGGILGNECWKPPVIHFYIHRKISTL